MNEQLYEQLRELPKEVLTYYFLLLLRDEKITFEDIAQTHVQYLKELKRGETERLIRLRTQIIDLWCGTKKDLPKSLVAIMQEFKDKGWANITQDKIDNSKWNK